MQRLLTCKRLGKAPPAVVQEVMQGPEMLPQNLLQEDNTAALRHDIPPDGRLVNVSTTLSETPANKVCHKLRAAVFILCTAELVLGKSPCR